MTLKDQRRSRDLDSIKALKSLLTQIAAAPAEYLENNVVVSMLQSQGAMAQYEATDAGIHRMSLNHHKVVADLAFGSYKSVDTLRRQAVHALEQEQRRRTYTRKNKKSDIAEKNQRLEQELVVLREDMVLLQRAYDLRCVQARYYAEQAGASTVALCTKEQREIEASFSLVRNRKRQEGNIVPMKDRNA